jgi:hypothetical protein
MVRFYRAVAQTHSLQTATLGIRPLDDLTLTE